MIAFDRAHAVPEPFPHLVLDDALPADAFAALVASYPDCPPGSGPTGRTIYRGDALFDAVMADNPAWNTLFKQTNTQAFTNRLAALFADEIRTSCRVDRAALHHIDHIENRVDKERTQSLAPTRPREEVFTRFDFMQGMNAYTRAPHLDHRRRLATVLIYFDSPEPDTFRGGDLVLHGSDGTPIVRIAPAANRAVLFPCSERSWHSVDAVTACHRPRRFVQIAISSCHNLWPDARLPDATMFAKGRRALRTLLARAA